MAVDLFIEAIKDDLTGRQIKELKQIVENENGDIEKARPKIIDKLLSFGKDVASNIVANILTNPSIWNNLF
jgi:ferritin-like metal-binding protein YciE